jgi:hypothetical protein
MAMRKQLVLTNSVVILLLSFFSLCYSQSQDKPGGFRAGFYQGTALNSTANAHGKVVFELYDFDQKNGHVRAYFGASDGLQGEAWLSGKVTNAGELDLTGNLASYRMEVRGHLAANGSINAEYALEGTNPQRGNFEVAFVNEIPSAMVNDSDFRSSPISNLIGAWEVGGALPAQVNPITGMSTGVSFVDVHRLQFFPDGSFKHLWSHRHCDGPRCCSEQAMGENGSYKLDGDRLSLTVTDGMLINTDMCNPKMTGHTPVKHGTFTYQTSLREGIGSPQLCLQQAGQAATCYQKQ